MIKVETTSDADAITRSRWRLKGSGVQVQDELSMQEMEAHSALWGTFQEAKKEGRKAWFIRAKLFVDGKEVLQGSTI